MPHIVPARRDILDSCSQLPNGPGELNYLITRLCLAYVHENGLSYQRINDVLGALEGAKLEFYRRLVVPYEDKKIEENGDVYPG